MCVSSHQYVPCALRSYHESHNLFLCSVREVLQIMTQIDVYVCSETHFSPLFDFCFEKHFAHGAQAYASNRVYTTECSNCVYSIVIVNNSVSHSTTNCHNSIYHHLPFIFFYSYWIFSTLTFYCIHRWSVKMYAYCCDWFDGRFNSFLRHFIL